MRNRNKLIIGGFVIAVIIAILYIKKNPVAAQMLQDNLPFDLPDMILPDGEYNYNINIPDYIARNIPLPDVGAGYTGRKEIGTACNFCLLSRTIVTTPAPPVKPAPPLMQPLPPKVQRFAMGGSNNASKVSFPNFDFAKGYLKGW